MNEVKFRLKVSWYMAPVIEYDKDVSEEVKSLYLNGTTIYKGFLEDYEHELFHKIKITHMIDSNNDNEVEVYWFTIEILKEQMEFV